MSGHGPAMAVAAPLADLLRAPGEGLERQYAHGEVVEVLGREGAHLNVRAARDGLRGWMIGADLRPMGAPATHAVRPRSSHLYPAPDLKAAPSGWLPFGARVAVGRVFTPEARADGGGRPPAFAHTPMGWVPMAHLRGLDAPEDDPVAVARRFLATPYLWGGDGPLGLDCSGLVQAAYLACGRACPADSGPQRAAFGGPLRDLAALEPGALIFWAGHVAMATGDGRMIHANAHHMAVAEEDAASGAARIAASGSPVLAVSRAP